MQTILVVDDDKSIRYSLKRMMEEKYSIGRMRHAGNPCLRWMADNIVLVSNAAGHRMPARKKSKNKIDGIVACVMARGRAAAGGSSGSYYETNGVERV